MEEKQEAERINCITDRIVFDGLGYEWIKVSNPFVDIQTRSH
jgi:hypothetical protein